MWNKFNKNGDPNDCVSARNVKHQREFRGACCCCLPLTFNCVFEWIKATTTHHPHGCFLSRPFSHFTSFSVRALFSRVEPREFGLCDEWKREHDVLLTCWGFSRRADPFLRLSWCWWAFLKSFLHNVVKELKNRLFLDQIKYFCHLKNYSKFMKFEDNFCAQDFIETS